MPPRDRQAYNEYLKNYMTRRYHRRRGEAIKQLGGRCVVCGESNPDKLEFDHVDSTTREFTIAKKLAGVSEEKLQAELEKCQLLCKKCHQEKTVSAGELPRGSQKPNTHLTENDIRAIRLRYRRRCRRNGANAIARDYKVSGATITSIIRRKTWKHV
jgi:5-methylcytosine-specific restriction endonuclease McrA